MSHLANVEAAIGLLDELNLQDPLGEVGFGRLIALDGPQDLEPVVGREHVATRRQDVPVALPHPRNLVRDPSPMTHKHFNKYSI